jgi:hypothetical protein
VTKIGSGKSMKGTRASFPLALAAAGLAFGLPSAGLAYVAITGDVGAENAQNINVFTPASVDPDLARLVAKQAGTDRVRFTPASASTKRDRTVTVAVRVDSDIAQAINIRSSLDASGGKGEGISAIASTRYNLGTARGYKSFARPTATLPEGISRIEMPDLANFLPAEPTAEDKPSRFQPRIALEGNGKPGRAEGTFEALGSQSVDLGGAYRITRNLDVTAGVRLSQERDRLAPITDSVQDSQAVYVGTQFRF